MKHSRTHWPVVLGWLVAIVVGGALILRLVGVRVDILTTVVLSVVLTVVINLITRAVARS